MKPSADPYGPALRAIVPFHSLSDADCAAVARDAKQHSVPPGSVIAPAGQFQDFAFGLMDGLAGLCAGEGERATIVQLFQPGTVIGLASLMTHEAPRYSLRAFAASQVLWLPGQPIRELFEHRSAFARATALYWAARRSDTIHALAEAKGLGTTHRLARWLLSVIPPSSVGEWVRLPLPKQDLAAFVGTTPENLSRSFVALGRHGVSTKRKEVMISSLAALNEAFPPLAEKD